MDGLVGAGLAAIGLTGGIGSGKSTVAQILVSCGAHLVDTDGIARAITQPGGLAIPDLVAAFGEAVLTPDGALDRQKMRALAFGDAVCKSRLEGVLHPLIGREAQRLSGLAAGRPVVFDVPLLAESRHWRARVQRVLVVDCEESTQIARVASRPGWTAQAAQAVVAQQAPRTVRRAIADAVIFNEGIDLARLEIEVRSLWRVWCLGRLGRPQAAPVP
ncbi:MAG TPA: dephospho-CoA kinase [Rubrivivax sp.]|nr:dephospho-CoA kinase [Rubrivivax sp.]